MRGSGIPVQPCVWVLLNWAVMRGLPSHLWMGMWGEGWVRSEWQIGSMSCVTAGHRTDPSAPSSFLSPSIISRFQSRWANVIEVILGALGFFRLKGLCVPTLVWLGPNWNCQSIWALSGYWCPSRVLWGHNPHVCKLPCSLPPSPTSFRRPHPARSLSWKTPVFPASAVPSVRDVRIFRRSQGFFVTCPFLKRT